VRNGIGDQSTVSAGDAVFGRIYERVVDSARDEAIVEYGNRSIVAAAAKDGVSGYGGSFITSRTTGAAVGRSRSPSKVKTNGGSPAATGSYAGSLATGAVSGQSWNSFCGASRKMEARRTRDIMQVAKQQVRRSGKAGDSLGASQVEKRRSEEATLAVEQPV